MKHFLVRSFDWDLFEHRVLAAFNLTDDGTVVFDAAVGDPDFVRKLQNGVRDVDGDGNLIWVTPDQGVAFVNACYNTFCSPEQSINDEDELRRLERTYPPPDSQTGLRADATNAAHEAA